MHFVSAKVGAKMLSQRVLFILCLDAHFGREFGPFWPHSTIWVVYKYIDTCNTLFKDIYFTLNLQIPQAANVGGEF